MEKEKLVELVITYLPFLISAISFIFCTLKSIETIKSINKETNFNDLKKLVSEQEEKIKQLIYDNTKLRNDISKEIQSNDELKKTLKEAISKTLPKE